MFGKKFHSIAGLAIASLLVCTACSAPQPTQSPIQSPVTVNQSPLNVGTGSQVPVPPADAPVPAPGKASISGVIYSYTISRITPGTMFYLTHGVGPDNRQMPQFLVGPSDSSGDIRGQTNDRGEFTLNNIPPGNYYLIVWAPANWPEADISPTNPTPRLIELHENQKQPLGVVYVGWP